MATTGFDYLVEVLVPPSQMTSAAEIETLPIETVNPLVNLMVRDVATVRQGVRPGEIDRSMSQRYVTLTANGEPVPGATVRGNPAVGGGSPDPAQQIRRRALGGRDQPFVGAEPQRAHPPHDRDPVRLQRQWHAADIGRHRRPEAQPDLLHKAQFAEAHRQVAVLGGERPRQQILERRMAGFVHRCL